MHEREGRRGAAPSGAPPSDAESPSTRDLILDVAERLFAAHGLEGVAVRDLARATGLTASSLYNHFPSKQAIYAAVLERGLRPLVELTTEAWPSGPLERDRMRPMLDRTLSHLAAHPSIATLLQRVLMEDAGKPDTRVAAWLRVLTSRWARLIRDAGMAAGWEEEELPHLTLALFVLTCAYFVSARTSNAVEPWSPDPFSPSEIAVQREFLEEAMFRLLGPRPRRRRRSPKKERR